jgi:hypothetical protein
VLLIEEPVKRTCVFGLRLEGQRLAGRSVPFEDSRHDTTAALLAAALLMIGFCLSRYMQGT